MASPQDNVEFMDDPRFSQTVELELPTAPADGGRRLFKITYADYGYRNEAHPEQENVFLFFGSLTGSRLIHVVKDELAKQHKIRFLNPDRPGFGGTDVVDAAHALSTWRGAPSKEAILALLRHLSIAHVAVGCHSGGTVYALDLLLHHPEVLCPDRPYLSIGAPWILPLHTSSTLMTVAMSLPPGMVSHTEKLARVINGYINPFLNFWCRLGELGQIQAAKLASKASRTGGRQAAAAVPRAPAEREKEAETERAKFEEDLWPTIIKRMIAEGVPGLSSDALLLLKKKRPSGVLEWGDWGDYDVLVPRLAEKLRASGRRLRVDVFFAENDALIGDGATKGPLWFNQCWDTTNGVDAGTIDYRSTIIQGADHDRIWNLRWGIVQEVFATVEQLAEEAES